MRLTHEGPTAEIIDSEYVELKFIFDRCQSFFSFFFSLSLPPPLPLFCCFRNQTGCFVHAATETDCVI